MQRLLRLLESLRDYLVAAGLSLVSIVLIANSDGPQVQVLRAGALAVFASAQTPTSWLASLFTARDEIRTMRTINMELMEEVMQLRRLKQENDELRSMVGFSQRSQHPLVPAEIVGKSTAPGQSTVTLNVGSDDGVATGMPVVHERGLVGKVISTSGGYSIVQLATSKTFRATAKIARTRVDGIIGWESGASLLLFNVLKTADVVPGDTIVTSEYSNTFPAEIPIGVVLSIGPGERGIFSRIDIRPGVEFERLERVFVIRYTRKPGQDELEQRVTPKEPT